MLTVNLICVGKLKEDYLRSAVSEYQKRLSAYCKLNIAELSEYKLSKEPSSAEIAKCIAEEGKAISSKIAGYLVPMCIEGKQLSSEELAKKLSDLSVSGTSEISFVIGGSYGIADEVKGKADFKLSMSKMTFPHQAARVMLLEQLYRAFSINSNGKYHK